MLIFDRVLSISGVMTCYCRVLCFVFVLVLYFVLVMFSWCSVMISRRVAYTHAGVMYRVGVSFCICRCCVHVGVIMWSCLHSVFTCHVVNIM